MTTPTPRFASDVAANPAVCGTSRRPDRAGVDLAANPAISGTFRRPDRWAGLPAFAERALIAARRGRVEDTVWAAVGATADAQSGVITADQLRDAGLPERTVRRAVTAGRLAPIHATVYAYGHAQLRDEGWLRAALLATAEDAVLSHETAAWWHGLLKDPPVRVDVATAANRRSTHAIDRHRLRLDAEDTEIVNGLWTTTVGRTLLDLALPQEPGVDHQAAADRLRRLLREAAYRRQLDRQQVEAVLARAKGHRGAKAFRAAIQRHHPELAFVRSELEARFVELLHAHRLPTPQLNAPVGEFTVDALWRPQRLVVELDGWRAHGTYDAFVADRRRDRTLTLADYRVLRFTWADVYHAPLDVAATIHRALGKR